jgi:hypothetical protein
MKRAPRFALVVAILFRSLILSSFAGDEHLPFLTGRILDKAPDTDNLLFTFKRSAQATNEITRVACDYFSPDGSRAVAEKYVYDHDALSSFEIDQFQIGAKGLGAVVGDKNDPSKKRLVLEWTTTHDGKPETKTTSEYLRNDTLVSDMIPGFIIKHWDELAGGKEVLFRCVIPSRLETVGFELVKESEMDLHGKKVLRLRMKASNFFAARLVAPIFFIVESEPAHRVLEYTGRTTPKLRKGQKWRDLDARVIFDWETARSN